MLFTNAKCGGTLLKSWFIGTLDIENTFSNFLKAVRHYGLGFSLNWYRHYFSFINGAKIINEDKYLRRFISDYRKSTQSVLPKVIDHPGWFHFAVVRNPYDRLVSAYVDKFCGSDLHKNWVQKVISEVNAFDAQGEPAITFSQFVDYLANQNIDEVNPHWRRQSFILENVQFHQIINLKDLPTALSQINTKLGLGTRIDLQVRRQSNTYKDELFNEFSFVGNWPNTQIVQHHQKTSNYPSKNLFYNDELRQKVQDIYQTDFELLSACP